MVGEPVDIGVVDLEFDQVNIEHLARHELTPLDVREVIQLAPRFFRNLAGRGGTHVMIGPNRDGRFLHVSLVETAIAGTWRPITGWQTGRRGRMLYESAGQQ